MEGVYSRQKSECNPVVTFFHSFVSGDELLHRDAVVERMFGVEQ